MDTWKQDIPDQCIVCGASGDDAAYYVPAAMPFTPEDWVESMPRFISLCVDCFRGHALGSPHTWRGPDRDPGPRPLSNYGFPTPTFSSKCTTCGLFPEAPAAGKDQHLRAMKAFDRLGCYGKPRKNQKSVE